MIESLIVFLLIFWFLGGIFYIGGWFIHILLIAAFGLVIYELLKAIK